MYIFTTQGLNWVLTSFKFLILSFFSWQELPNIFKYTKLFVLILIPNLCKNKIYKFSWIKPYQDNPDMTFLVVFTLYIMLWWATLQNLVITFTRTTNSFKSMVGGVVLTKQLTSPDLNLMEKENVTEVAIIEAWCLVTAWTGSTDTPLWLATPCSIWNSTSNWTSWKSSGIRRVNPSQANLLRHTSK